MYDLAGDSVVASFALDNARAFTFCIASDNPIVFLGADAGIGTLLVSKVVITCVTGSATGFAAGSTLGIDLDADPVPPPPPPPPPKSPPPPLPTLYPPPHNLLSHIGRSCCGVEPLGSCTTFLVGTVTC